MHQNLHITSKTKNSSNQKKVIFLEEGVIVELLYELEEYIFKVTPKLCPPGAKRP